MKKAWQDLKKTHPGIFTYGCAAHGLNLLSQDILKSDGYKNGVDDIVQISKAAKHSQFISSMLKRAIQLPCKKMDVHVSLC